MASLTIEKKLQYKAEAYLLLVALMWGVSFPVVKIALNYSSPFIFVFFRFLITSLIFLIFFYKDLNYAKFIDYKYGVIIGIALFFGYTTQTIGLKYSSASNTAFITGTNIVFLPFLQMLVVKTKPGKENIIGIIIVLIGLYL